ncbi:hypothetical protein WJX82_001269 [Trebouxia sp. C0006]
MTDATKGEQPQQSALATGSVLPRSQLTESSKDDLGSVRHEPSSYAAVTNQAGGSVAVEDQSAIPGSSEAPKETDAPASKQDGCQKEGHRMAEVPQAQATQVQAKKIAGSSTSTTQQAQVNVTVAQDFTVQYMDSYKIVTNLYVNETYVLYQCGTTAPDADVVPAGSKFFEIPLTSVTVVETIPYAYLQALNVTDRVYSVSADTVAPCGQLQVACTQIAPLAEMLNDTEYLDTELLPYVDGIITSTPNASISPLFAFSASTDPGSLNRAEWLKFMGLFFNMDDFANTVFDEINSTYYANSAMYTSAAAMRSNTTTVAWVDRIDNITDYANAFEVSFAQYKVQYTSDAGGNMTNQSAVAAMTNVVANPYTVNTQWFAWDLVDVDLTGGFATEADAVTAFHAFLQTVDVLIDETYAEDPTQYNFTTFLQTFELTSNVTSNATYPFLKNAAVFREDGLLTNSSALYNGDGLGDDWFEGALLRPDLVLSDVARAINSSNVPQGYNFTWIRNLATGEVPTIQSPLGCTTPATGISVVASEPTGAPASAPALSAISAAASAPSPSGSEALTTIVDGDTTAYVLCPVAAAEDVPTICPFVSSCGATLMTNYTNGCQYTPCTA